MPKREEVILKVKELLDGEEDVINVAVDKEGKISIYVATRMKYIELQPFEKLKDVSLYRATPAPKRRPRRR
jgi:hypothetical protein